METLPRVAGTLDPLVGVAGVVFSGLAVIIAWLTYRHAKAVSPRPPWPRAPLWARLVNGGLYGRISYILLNSALLVGVLSLLIFVAWVDDGSHVLTLVWAGAEALHPLLTAALVFLLGVALGWVGVLYMHADDGLEDWRRWARWERRNVADQAWSIVVEVRAYGRTTTGRLSGPKGLAPRMMILDLEDGTPVLLKDVTVLKVIEEVTPWKRVAPSTELVGLAPREPDA